MEKVRYEIDPHNRLVIYKAGKKASLPRFRKVIDGQFKTDRDNNLSYHVKAPFSEIEDIPHQVKLRGTWSMADDHDLRLTIDKLGRDTFGDEITLQGEILDAKEDSLLFAITTKRKDGTESTYVLNLAGSWKADENNRLTFHVKREKGLYDILIFDGAWELDKNHQIIYQYEKAALIRKRKKIQTLTFKGHWDIRDKGRISYLLSHSTDSVFNFRTSAGLFKEDYIKYELGIDLTNRARPTSRTITLFGGWKLKKDVGLIFEVEYEDKKVQKIAFGADARLTDKDTVLFRLKDSIEDKYLGASVELSHKILKGDGEAFLRFLKAKEEGSIYAGAAWRW